MVLLLSDFSVLFLECIFISFFFSFFVVVVLLLLLLLLGSHPLSTERAKNMEVNLLPKLLELYSQCDCQKKKRKNVTWGRVTERSMDLPMFVKKMEEE